MALEDYELEIESDRVVLREALETVENIIHIFTGEDAFPGARNVLVLMPLRVDHRIEWLLEVRLSTRNPFPLNFLSVGKEPLPAHSCFQISLRRAIS